jgi:hypothetical protein
MVKCLSPIEGISKVEQNAGIGSSDKTRENTWLSPASPDVETDES